MLFRIAGSKPGRDHFISRRTSRAPKRTSSASLPRAGRAGAFTQVDSPEG